MIIKRKKSKVVENKKIINEAVQVEGAELLSTFGSYDLFKINTWEAAQEFTSGDQPAGAKHAQSQDTFNTHIVNGSNKLYFMVEANTNHVVKACITQRSMSSGTRVLGANVNTNIQIENVNGNAGQPILRMDNLRGIPELKLGDSENKLFITNDNTLFRFTNLLVDLDENRITIPEGITTIKSGAFKLENMVNDSINGLTVFIPSTVDIIEENAFNSNLVSTVETDVIDGTYKIEWDLNNNFNGIEVIWDINSTDEERAARAEREDLLARNRQAKENIENRIRELLTDIRDEYGNDDYYEEKSAACSELFTTLDETAVDYVDRLNELFQPILSEIETKLNTYIEWDRVHGDIQAYFSDKIKEADVWEDSRIKKLFDELNDNLNDDITVDELNATKTEYEKPFEELIKQVVFEKTHTFIYRFEGNNATIVGVRKHVNVLNQTIAIPSEIEGHPVTKIGDYAFFDKGVIYAVVLPETVKYIGRGAFAHTKVNYLRYQGDNIKNISLGRDALGNNKIIHQ